MKPLISVIVPIYNQEKYVAECLESLFSQATERVEFILIDDGSTDRSAAICEANMANSGANARLLRQKNHGLLKTREIGLHQTTGEYVLFVDSDDCLLDGALDALMRLLDADRPDIVLFNATNDKDGKAPLFAYPFADGAVFTGAGKYPLYRLLCGTDKLNNIWAKCVRRALFDDPELYQDIEGISNGEDLYQSLVLIDRAEKVLFLDRVLYYYRVTNVSMSRSYNPRHFASEKKVCARRLRYAEKWSRNGGELVADANIWICKIMRDVTRKLFVSSLPWPKIAAELRRLREDDFYRAHYIETRCDPNPRDTVLKSPLPLMRLWKLLYGLKPRG